MNSMQTFEQNAGTANACAKTTALDCTSASPTSNGISNGVEGAIIASFENISNKRAPKFSDKSKVKGHRSSQRLLHEVMSKKLAEAQYTKEMKAHRGTKALHRSPPADTNPKRKHNNLEPPDQESTQTEGTRIHVQQCVTVFDPTTGIVQGCSHDRMLVDSPLSPRPEWMPDLQQLEFLNETLTLKSPRRSL